jgi:hypothetical protein
MTAYRCITQIVLVTAGALIVGACAAPVTPPIQADKTETPKVAALPAAEPTVFGRLELLQDGKHETISAIDTFDVYGIAALVLPEGTDTAQVLSFDQQGWFAWTAKPGTYSLLGLVSQSGNSIRTIPIDARFVVEDGDSLVYIGHIHVESKGSRFGGGITDSDVADEVRKRYGDTATPAKRLLQRADKLGTYAKVRSVCDKTWGLPCTHELRGVTPIQPKVARGIHGTTFGRADSVSPALKWQAAGTSGVSYDVAIWEAAAYRLPSKMSADYWPGHLALYEENVVATELTLTKPLKPKTRYFWSVRARQGDVVSSWSRAGHSTFLVVAWTSGSGEWFAFETP